MANLFEDIGNVLEGVGPLLETIAPTIASMIGGPLAGTAVTLLEKGLGLTPGAGATAVSAALIAPTPDQISALKKIDDDFKVQMKDADVQLAAVDEKDRESARTMEMSTKDRTPDILSYLLTLGFFGSLGSMMFINVPPAAHDILLAMIGFLGNAWYSSIGFFFGSSRGSQQKDAMLFNSTPSTTTKAKK